MTAANPSREDFAALLNESFKADTLMEGAVIKGTVVGIEKDVAVIDVGLKTEGRVSLKEFSMPGMPVTVKIGDQVEVYLERVENALGEAALVRSAWSRALISASSSASSRAIPKPLSSSQRRPARTSGTASTNSLAVALGAITVPISRPSMTAPGAPLGGWLRNEV